MKPMTDRELEALFRKHVPGRGAANSWGVDPGAEFVGSRFYAFARELEHSALTMGMLAAFEDPGRAPRALVNANAARVAGGVGLAGWIGSLFGLR